MTNRTSGPVRRGRPPITLPGAASRPPTDPPVATVMPSVVETIEAEEPEVAVGEDIVAVAEVDTPEGRDEGLTLARRKLKLMDVATRSQPQLAEGYMYYPVRNDGPGCRQALERGVILVEPGSGYVLNENECEVDKTGYLRWGTASVIGVVHEEDWAELQEARRRLREQKVAARTGGNARFSVGQTTEAIQGL